MSIFLGLTPSIRVVLENPFLHRTYPLEGMVNAVIDTGYEGFFAVPESVFQELKLNELQGETRTVELADKRISKSKGAYASVRLPHISTKIHGFIETFSGLDEILVGVEALSNTRAVLDYCTKRVRIEPCQRILI